MPSNLSYYLISVFHNYESNLKKSGQTCSPILSPFNQPARALRGKADEKLYETSREALVKPFHMSQAL